jgi:acetyltransferase-like isoleucine patch superfamily enzyme
MGPRDCAARLSILRLCYLNSDVFIDLNGAVSLGDQVTVGHHVRFISSSYTVGPSSHRCGIPTHAPIRVEDGCWIGSGAVLLPGNHLCGYGAIVAAGAVVTCDAAPNAMVGGVLAKLIRLLPPESYGAPDGPPRLWDFRRSGPSHAVLDSVSIVVGAGALQRTLIEHE